MSVQNHSRRATRVKHIIGLHPVAFDDLLDILGEYTGWDDPTGGRPKALLLHDALKMVLLYFKANLTEELLADMFGVSQPTVSRTIAALEHPIVALTAWAAPPLADAKRAGTVLIDGTLLRCWSWSSHRTCGPVSTTPPDTTH